MSSQLQFSIARVQHVCEMINDRKNSSTLTPTTQSNAIRHNESINREGAIGQCKFNGWVGNLAKVVALMAMLSVLLGWCGRWHFALDLFCHFRVQAAILLGISALVLLGVGRWKAAMAVLVMVIAVAATLLPFVIPVNDHTEIKLRLLTVNVLSRNLEREHLIEFILQQDPDLILLQETNGEWVQELDQALSEKWPISKTVPRSDNFGIAMYSKIQWDSCEIVQFTTLMSTPSLVAKFKLADGRQMEVINTHPLPPINSSYWNSRNAHFAGLANHVVESDCGQLLIVAGDFNCSPWSYWFRQMLSKSGLSNAAVGQGLFATWKPCPLPGSGLPIDHVLVGSEIECIRLQPGPDVGSDHRPVMLDFAW
jgi:endonuclease/exonuclease/phosphatase (EEP) superfamily protein YafD